MPPHGPAASDLGRRDELVIAGPVHAGMNDRPAPARQTLANLAGRQACADGLYHDRTPSCRAMISAASIRKRVPAAEWPIRRESDPGFPQLRPRGPLMIKG